MTDFSKCMNHPEDGFDGQADIKTFPDGSRWAVCPWCGKKAIKILSQTKIHLMPWKCKGTNCRKNFFVNVGMNNGEDYQWERNLKNNKTY